MKVIFTNPVPRSRRHIPRLGGKHLSPREWHNILTGSDHENTVLVDVRNKFEHEIGHLVHPKNTTNSTMNPNMVTFSIFDSTYCAKQAPLSWTRKFSGIV
jgi:predicted sulfurtransferase